jgi:pimeloyl-ACP methyl ester carboxylesterase
MATVSSALAELTTPTLVVAGDHDDRQAQEVAAAVPGARYVRVPGNHFTALLSPELEDAILAFLAQPPR